MKLLEYNGTVPDGWCTGSIYRVILKPTDEDEQVERKSERRIHCTVCDRVCLVALDFTFAYTPTYPDEAPHLRMQRSSISRERCHCAF